MSNVLGPMIFADNQLGIPEQLRGKVKTVGCVYNEPIKYGDINMLTPGDLYYMNSVKQVYRFYGELNGEPGYATMPGDDTNPKSKGTKSSPAALKSFIFTPIKFNMQLEESQLDDGGRTRSAGDEQTVMFVIPNDQLGKSHRVGYLFKDIIYGGDVNLVPNGGLYYNEDFPFVAVVSNDDVNIVLSYNLEDTTLMDPVPFKLDIDYNPDTGKADEYIREELEVEWIEDTTIYQWPSTIQCRFEFYNNGEAPIKNIIVANKKVGTTTTYEELFKVKEVKPGKSITTGFDIPITSNVPSTTTLNYYICYKIGDSEKWINYGLVNYEIEPHNFEADYLTLEALEDGTFTFTVPLNNYGGTLDVTSFGYSLDDGETWTTTARASSGSTLLTTPEVKAGKKVLWKGIGNRYCSSTGPGIYSTFSSTCKFNVYGNLLSMCYGDEFEDQTEAKVFGGMFKNSNVVSAENLSLPATTLAAYCYYYMFYQCSQLTKTPTELPATTLENYCYAYMFIGCTLITETPNGSVTTAASSCCYSMFQRCSALTLINMLLKSASNDCYQSMFYECTSLTSVPHDLLSATTLATGCYNGMFQGCTSLTTAPELPATTLAQHCYSQMFYNCSSLNYIKMLATDISAYNCLYNWVANVSETGMFKKNSDAEWSTTGSSGIPTGWTVKYAYLDDYLTFEVLLSGKIKFTINLRSSTSEVTSVSYSLDDGLTWTTKNNLYNSSVEIITPTLQVGDKVLWKGTATNYGKAELNSGKSSRFFSVNNCRFKIYGNIMSMLYGDNFESLTSLPSADGTFNGMFTGTNLIDAENLILPATAVKLYCYAFMFSNCTLLTTAPRKLPATTLDYYSLYCYYSMFSGCSNLVKTPELLATQLTPHCYEYMFMGCISLITAPALPATNIAVNCYSCMFYNCTSLINVPSILPATSLWNYCYASMFYGCSSLTTAPELPTTYMSPNCYANMFNGCTSLNNITMLATNISASGCLTNWVNNVATSGTFTKAASMETLPEGSNGIPSGWTVESYPEEEPNAN